MRKQYIIAGAIIVLVIIFAAGTMALSQNNKVNGPAAANPPEENAIELSQKKEDLGACTMVSKDTIKAELGAAAATLSGPQDTGVTGLGDGDKGQTCIYPFLDGGSVYNSFYIDVASYASQATFDEVTQYSSDGITVDVGDVAYFTRSEPITSKSTELSLKVQKDKKVILFVISQPTASMTFTNETAQSALTKIALAAKL